MLHRPNIHAYALQALSAFAVKGQTNFHMFVSLSYNSFSLGITCQTMIASSEIVPTLLNMLHSDPHDITTWKVGMEGLLILELF